MPLPWKKTRVATISRFVADLHSPKRGGSLVVQTGFPTSLVDLFVKNHDRLKKKKTINIPQIETDNEICVVNSPSDPPVAESELGVNEFLSSKATPKSEICEESEGNKLMEEIQVEEQVTIKDVLMHSYNDDRPSTKSSKFKLKLMRRLVPKKLKEKKEKNKLIKNQVEMEDDENDFNKEEERHEARGSSDRAVLDSVSQHRSQEIKHEGYGYLILILIVLVGLVGGRIVALLLLLVWFFMLKFIGYHHSRKYLLL